MYSGTYVHMYFDIHDVKKYERSSNNQSNKSYCFFQFLYTYDTCYLSLVTKRVVSFCQRRAVFAIHYVVNGVYPAIY